MDEAAELRRLAALTTLPTIAKLLEEKAAEIAAAATTAATATTTPAHPPPLPVAATPSPAAATNPKAELRLIKKKITTYGWDQARTQRRERALSPRDTDIDLIHFIFSLFSSINGLAYTPFH